MHSAGVLSDQRAGEPANSSSSSEAYFYSTIPTILHLALSSEADDVFVLVVSRMMATFIWEGDGSLVVGEGSRRCVV